MTKPLIARCILLAGASLVGFASSVSAQAAPTTSPYLNLLRRGNPTYLNYYGLVQPQIQAQAAIGGLTQQVGQLNTALQTTTPGSGDASGLSTGHGFGFFTHRSYFLTTGGGGGGGIGGGQRGGIGAGGGGGIGGGGIGGGGGIRR